MRYGRHIIMLTLFMLVGYLLFYLTYENVRKELIENLNERQMIHARQTVIGIETFFNDHVRQLKHLAENEHIADLDKVGIGLMRDYHLTHPEEVSIITRIDREGRILHPEPYDAAVVRQPVTTMDDFNEVKRTGQIVVSDVFTNRRGFKTIIIHTPIYRKGSFDGTLALLIPFDFIARRYVENIRIGQDGYAWVISKGGIELTCPVPGHAGKSVFDNCRDFPDILAMAKRMMRGEQGIATYQYDRIRGNTVSKAVKQAAFMPIRLGNNFWSIVIASPEQEALSSLHGFRNRLALLALLFVIGVGLFFYLLFKAKIQIEKIEGRRKTEEALRAKTEELDRYFTSSLDLLCIADTDGFFHRLNPEWERTLGYPLAELEGKRFLDLVHPDDVESTLIRVRELSDAKEVQNFVNRYRHKDGTYRWIEWRSYPVEKMIYAVARDITERMQAEEEQRLSRERAERLAEETAVIADIGRLIGSTLDIHEVYEKFAAETRKLISFDRISVTLCNIHENTLTVAYVSGVDLPHRKQGDTSPLTGTVSEMAVRGRTGLIIQPESTDEIVSRIPILSITFQAKLRSMMCVPLISRDEVFGALHFRSRKTNAYAEGDLRIAERIGAQIAGAIANAQLFEELKKTETSLRESEGRFRTLVENAAVGVAEIDIGTSRFITVNRRLCEMVGRTEEELLAITFHAITHPEDTPLDEEKRALLQAGKIGHYTREKRYLRKDGGIVWVNITISPLWKPGEKPERNMIVVEDITERKKMEEERLKLEERLNRAEKMEFLGQLAGGIAHDLNNVLGVLVGYSELLQEKIPEISPLRRYVDNIMQSGLKAAAIIQDLLTLARRGVAVSEAVNLNRIVTDYLRSPEFENVNDYHPLVTFKTDLGEDLLNIRGSQVHLTKTVMNLVSNAAEAISDRGEVTIQTENRHLDQPLRGYDDMKEGDYVILTVSDTGKGISPADIGKIFEPFYTKKVMGRSGTGLGLSVVWGTVKDHNGYIDVRSDEGKGSVFTLYFPVTREEMAKDRKAIPPDAFMCHGESILVVDDVKEQRELAANMLTRLGCRVSAVSSGEEALEYLKTNRADLIILDMIMDPGMDGLETYRKILEIRPGQKAVIVSGFSETDKVRKAQELGAGAYVRKPYMLEKIGLAVRQMLNP